MHTEQELREEFKNFYPRTRYINADEITDWWLSKLTTQQEELKRKVDGLKRERSELPMKGSHYKFGYDQALQDVLHIISPKAEI